MWSYVASTNLAGQNDADLNTVAADEERVIVTRDLDFPLQGVQHPAGVLLLRVPSTYRRRDIARFMQQFADSSDLGKLTGKVTVIAPGREPRSRPIPHA
jgi:hypothetical protein